MPHAEVMLRDSAHDGLFLGERGHDLGTVVYQIEDKTFLVDVGVLSPNGTKIIAQAMGDDATITVELTIEEWNALPFHWFEDKVEATRRERNWP